MRNQKRTREQCKADASARIAAVCLFLAALLILALVAWLGPDGRRAAKA